MALSSVSRKQWILLALAAGLACGLMAALTGWILAPEMRLVAASASFATTATTVSLLVLLLGSTTLRQGLIAKQLEDAVIELRSAVGVRPLAGMLPITLGGWAIDATFGHTLVDVIRRTKPKLIVECGSGSSTVLMAYVLCEMRSDSRIISFEHDPHYGAATSQELADRGLENWARVVVGPLTEWKIDGVPMLWYGVALRDELDTAIDLLVVDGPPAATGRKARYPAVPLLHTYLSETCAIILDDGARADEHEIAHRWAREIGGALEYVKGPKGAWVIRSQQRESKKCCIQANHAL